MRVAFVGAGVIAPEHLKAVRAAGGEVVAVCSRGPSAAKFASHHQIAASFNDVPRMLKETKPDCLFLLTSPISYKDILSSIQPIEMPVFLEKPLGITVKETRKLRSLLPPTTFVGLNRRFYHWVKPIREMLNSDRGCLIQAVLAERARDFCGRSEVERNSWLMLNGIHLLDLLFYLAGEPDTIQARVSWGQSAAPRLPQFTSICYRTRTKHQIQLAVNLDSPGGWRIHAFLSGKEIAVSPLEQCNIRDFSGACTITLPSEHQDLKPGFLEQTRCFFAGVRNPDQLPAEWVSFDSALTSMTAIETLFNLVS